MPTFHIVWLLRNVRPSLAAADEHAKRHAMHAYKA